MNRTAEGPPEAFRIGVPIITGQLVPLGEDLAPRDPARAPTEKEKRLFRLENGLLAGRVLATEVLSAVGSYRHAATGTRLCASSGFSIVRARICGATDILVPRARSSYPFESRPPASSVRG